MTEFRRMVEARRVVVTGLGPVSCLGVGKEANWDSAVNGRSGIHHIDELRHHVVPMEGLPVRIGGEVPDEFDVTNYMNPKEARRTD
ncbi:MAG TPA: beta-ketoacyl synthase N-terminal-like domain-containing protein, partial [Actinomycetota bacterium]|nr:beta-ketoacyl synthase N-terminal-like domain-containing protein [Actinomycetota bacterium]